MSQNDVLHDAASEKILCVFGTNSLRRSAQERCKVPICVSGKLSKAYAKSLLTDNLSQT